MKLGVVLLPILLFLSGCSHAVNDKSDDKNFECSSDSDCAAAGCSSQLCVGADKASGIITTCEYKEEYSCLKLTSCGCINNKCSWNENENYLNCLEEVRG